MSGSVPEKSHAELGASVASRWMACPGSIRLSRTVPTPPTTSFAQEGTAAHALAELALRKGVDPDMWLGMTLEGVEVTEDMVDFVRVFVDHVRTLALSGGVLWIERRFDLHKMNPPGPMFGTADAVVLDATTLHVVDLKYGQGVVVEAKGNKQLRYYALGALLSIDDTILLQHIEEVTMWIVQPRAQHPDGVIRSETISFDELVGFANELMDAARKTQEPDAPLNPGSHCRFCPAAGICSAQRERALAVAQVEFDALPVVGPPDPALLTPEETSDLLAKLHILEDWAAALRAHAIARLERGEPLPGYKLVAKRATRKWKDEKEAEQWLRAKGFESEEILVSKLKSPAQVEKLVGKKNLPPDLTTKESSSYNMAPESDPRPALELGAGHEFAALPAASE